MNKQELKEIVQEQHQLEYLPDYIAREVYQDLTSLQQSKHIIVIIGLRRCGKSTLMQKLRQQSKHKDFYINFDDDRLVNFALKDFQTLLEIFIELYGEQKTVFFDEIQNIPQWERFVRRLHDQGYKIYITGSNATLFSRELGTRLTGRYIELQLYPFSFLEFNRAINYEIPKNMTALTTTEKATLKRHYNKYAIVGGIPDYVKRQQLEYLQTLYESILYRDIVARYRISNVKAFRELVYYLASNVGKEVTFNSLRKLLNIASPTTVSDYCSYLQDSFLCFFINRFDFSLKKQNLYAKKIYFIDPAMAKAIGFRTSEDHGCLLENIVFIELLRRRYDVYFHKQQKECDFVLRQQANIIAVMQVCWDLQDKKTKQREIDGLVEAMRTYHLSQGTIISFDEYGQEDVQHDGVSYQVNIIPIWRWLLSNKITDFFG
jgi:uncharacterized protein